MLPEHFRTLVELHRGIWTEDLLGEDWQFIFENVLTENEREILKYKVHGFSDARVDLLKNYKPGSTKRMCVEIKYKYRNGIGRRVDNHPFFNKKWVNWGRRKGRIK